MSENFTELLKDTNLSGLANPKKNKKNSLPTYS